MKFFCSIKRFVALTLFSSSLLITGLAILPVVVGGVGCTSGNHGQLQNGVYTTTNAGDPTVIDAEQVLGAAVATFPALMSAERANHIKLQASNPDISGFTDGIRMNGKGQLTTLIDAKEKFQNSRAPADLATLTTALASVKSTLVLASNYLAQALK